jgi:hypothetical protein
MKSKRITIGAAVALLLVAAGYGIFRTRPPASPAVGGRLSATSQITTANPQGQPLVDQSPLTTAQRLAQTQNSSVEEPYAKEALRLADQEMDLAFATAVREAAEHPPALSPEGKQIQAKRPEVAKTRSTISWISPKRR